MHRRTSRSRCSGRAIGCASACHQGATSGRARTRPRSSGSRPALRRGDRAPGLRSAGRAGPPGRAVLVPASPALVRRAGRVPARQRKARRARPAPVRRRAGEPAADGRRSTCDRPARRATVRSRARCCAWRAGASSRSSTGAGRSCSRLRPADEFSAVGPFQRGRGQRQGGPMKVGTEAGVAGGAQGAAGRRAGAGGARQARRGAAARAAVGPRREGLQLRDGGGRKPLPELFEGRSQLLIYHLMFGEDWAVGVPGLLVACRRTGRRGGAAE